MPARSTANRGVLKNKGGVRGGAGSSRPTIVAGSTNTAPKKSNVSSGGGGPKKIIIKPFSKPPTLPPNFYETTSEQLLKGTLEILQQQQELAQKSSLTTNSNDAQHSSTSSNSNKLSLQNSYTSVCNLVSHQYGPRLYKDLRKTMHEAAVLVLPDNTFTGGGFVLDAATNTTTTNTTTTTTGTATAMDVDRDTLSANAAAAAATAATTGATNSSSSSNSKDEEGTELLSHIQKQYELYVEYILLCKHVFLPLDRAHLWQEDGQIVVKRTMSTSHTHCTLWEVGLLQFRLRLIELSLHKIVYKYWFHQLMNDWVGKFALRQLLQSTWHMWQDLHMLPTLLTELQRDLEQFLTTCSTRYKQMGPPYPASPFINFVYDKWNHMSYQWTFLPKTWLCSLLEVHLLQPHLHPDWLLAPQHFHPMLEEELHSMNNTNATTAVSTATTQPGIMNTPPSMKQRHGSVLSSSPMIPNRTNNNYQNQSAVVKLWMLAGRLPNGYKQLSLCIANYAKTKGLALIQSASVTATTATATRSSPQKMSDTQQQQQQQNNATNMIADLLDLQQQLYRLVHYKLPKGNDHINLKPVWEDVINTPTAVPSVAECVAKFVDQILKSPKKMDQYALSLQAQQNQQQQQYLQKIPPATTATVATGGGGGASAASPTSLMVSAPGNSSNDLLSRIISGIFVHLQAKDIFEAFYKRDLAKRLLWNRVVSMDVEKQFCSLLKAECGSGYTSKMEGMFQDIDWSREAMSRYKQTNFMGVDSDTESKGGGGGGVRPSFSFANNAANSPPTVDMEVQVLTTGYWPVYPQYPNLILPEALKIPQDRFTNHYKTKYQGRRMSWQYALGHCLVRANHFKSGGEKGKNPNKRYSSNSSNRNSISGAAGGTKVYELVVSLCQALVLIQFVDDTMEFTLPQLMSKVGLEDRDEMERILQSLSLGKDGTRILRKRDHDADAAANTTTTTTTLPQKKPHRKIRINVHDQDKFVINTNFESNQRRIRVTNIMLKESKEERDKTVETVSRDRLYMIDASLVRIMKARKTILHQQLIPQVLEQVKVPVTSSDIKKRIESLIEREYMERDTKDRARYNYLA